MKEGEDIEKRELWVVIGIALVVAIIASITTASITGNVIRLNQDTYGQYQVYTKAEIDSKFAEINRREYLTSNGVLNLLNGCQAINTAQNPDDGLTGDQVCVNIGKRCIASMESFPWKSGNMDTALFVNCNARGRYSSQEGTVGRTAICCPGTSSASTTTLPTTTPSITIISPQYGTSFVIGNTIPITYSFSGALPEVQVELELKLVQTSYPITGSLSRIVLDPKTSSLPSSGTRTYSWTTNLSNYPEIPGLYEIIARIRDCNVQGCNIAPPGAIRATSNLVRININSATSTSSGSCGAYSAYIPSSSSCFYGVNHNTGVAQPANTIMNAVLLQGSTASCPSVSCTCQGSTVSPQTSGWACAGTGTTTTLAGGQTSTSSVDLKVNGYDGPVTLLNNQQIIISWTSTNLVSCGINRARLTPTGNDYISRLPSSGIRVVYNGVGVYGDSRGNISIKCAKADGSAGGSDYVIVNVVAPTTSAWEMVQQSRDIPWVAQMLDQGYTPFEENVTTFEREVFTAGLDKVSVRNFLRFMNETETGRLISQSTGMSIFKNPEAFLGMPYEKQKIWIDWLVNAAPRSPEARARVRGIIRQTPEDILKDIVITRNENQFYEAGSTALENDFLTKMEALNARMRSGGIGTSEYSDQQQGLISTYIAGIQALPAQATQARLLAEAENLRAKDRWVADLRMKYR